MFNFFKKQLAAPEWFSSNGGDYTYFIRLVEKVSKKIIPEYAFSDDKSSLVCNDATGKETKRLNLNNIAGICIKSNRKDREEIVKNFLASINQPSLNEIDNFDEICSLIAVQVYPTAILSQTKIPILYMEIIPETITVLVFDSTDKIEFVKPDRVEKWHRTVDELFTIGIKNTKHVLKGMPFPEIGNGSLVQVSESENVLTACTSLFLEEANNAYNENGIIFAIPNRHVIITLPITKIEVISKELPFMAFFAQRVFSANVYPINPNIYWIKDGKYLKLPYTIENKTFNFFPPQEFVDTLNKLA